jgi:hypothetical protein
VVGTAPPPAAPPPAAGPGPAAAAPLWEDLFRGATPAQQRELLDLARRQGVLYAHQLPPSNGSTGDRTRSLLGHVLAGQTRDLAPVRAAPVAVTDADLDDCQRDAVARALATPDVCLIQGLPGTGKSRVVAEIVTQAAARGERVLLLAPDAAPVDRVLEAVADRPGLCPIRCLGRNEAAEALPAAVRRLTLLERLHQLRDESLPRARGEIGAAEEHLRRVRQDEARWPAFRDLAAQRRELTERRAALDAARGRVDAEVERDAAAAEATPSGGADGAFAASVRATVAARDDALARLADDLAKAEARFAEVAQEEQALKAQLDGLRPLAEARQHGHWWSVSWWRSLSGDVVARAEELDAKRRHAADEMEALGRQKQGILAEQERAKERYASERGRLAAAEGARRRDEQDAQEAALGHDEQLLQGKWQAACRQLDEETARRAAALAPDGDALRAVWQGVLREAEERVTFARLWAACLEEAADTFPQRLPGLCNLAAGTLASLASDPYFGDAAANRVTFDLLVLEAADQATEAEFLAAARRARRWVLVGQPAAGEAEAAKAVRPASLRPGLFQRLWQQLHCDPRRLPYAWVQEQAGLCCQLRPLTPEQTQWLETEPLADSPDIQLRILTMPRCQPLLAEVVFPASVSIQQAKEYIFRELQELPVHAAGRGLRWVEDSDRIVLRLDDAPAPGAAPVALDTGVREMLHPAPADGDGPPPRPAGWRTCYVEFERGAGWHRDTAEAWVERHLGLRDLGRTARLDVPYRMCRDLALFLSELLFEGEYRLPARAADGPAVEFVPVPSPREGVRHPAGAVLSGRRAAPGRGRGGQAVHAAHPPRKGGAGLEVDLADPHHRDRLPGEYRAALPNAGMANFLEAQAVVRTLEDLAADPAVRAARPSVGVIALYPGQAALIRRLLQGSRAAALGVTVDVPAGFRERECDVALVSLTRSHGHRAVSFGDGPQALAVALTRARSRLLVFGDVGTLARRAQWPHPLDHLDEAASARERALAGRLAACAEGQGPHAHLVRLREGSQA